MSDHHDQLYRGMSAPSGQFQFNAEVARVFPDMIRRSVPGYAMMLDMIRLLTARLAQPETALYDLGCALGASTLAMREGLRNIGTCDLVAIDSSREMIRSAQDSLSQSRASQPISWVCADICQVEFQASSMMTLHLTLQFVRPPERLPLLCRIQEALVPGGGLILSEKIATEDLKEAELLNTWHHDFKADQGYSQLEIARKRSALESVLIPETLQEHRERLMSAGFSRVVPWFQCFNFHSFVALK